MSNELKLKLKPSEAFRIHTMLQDTPTDNMGMARKVVGVMDALETVFNIDQMSDARAMFLMGLADAGQREKKGEGSTEDKLRLRKPLHRLQLELYREFDVAEAKEIEVAKPHVEGVLDLLGTGQMDDLGRRALIALSDAMKDAERHGE